MGAWIKRKKVMNMARTIRSEKLRVHQYAGGYARCFESKRVEWNENNNLEQK